MQAIHSGLCEGDSVCHPVPTTMASGPRNEAVCVICLDSCPPNKRVQVLGLVRAPHYNGRFGHVEGKVDGSERLKVVLEGRGNKVLSLKEENIVAMEESAPIQSGCACRGDAGLAHVACRVKAAESCSAEKGGSAWRECPTCKQQFTGEMMFGLAESRWTRVSGREQVGREWQEAAEMMGWALFSQGRYKEAEGMSRKVLEVRQQVLWAEHPCMLDTKTNLASSLSFQGKYAEAEIILREVLAVMRRKVGPEHPNTLATAANLAACLASSGKSAEAEKIEREVLAAEQRVLGKEHPGTLNTASNLASSLSDQDKAEEAEKMQREVLAVQERVLGKEHPDTLRSAGDLATSLSKQGKHEEAEKMRRKVLAVQQRVLGAQHPFTLGTANGLASSLSDQGKPEEAEKMQREVLAAQERALGKEHPATRETSRSLWTSLAKQGKNEEAKMMLRDDMMLLSAQMKKLVKDLRKAEENPKVTWSMITEAVSGSREFGAIVAKMPQEDIKRFVHSCLKFNIKKGGEEEVQKGVRQSS